MTKKVIVLFGSALLIGSGMLFQVPAASAATNMFNMFNPSKWFGSDRRYDDYYYDRGPYGYRGWGPGWGYGPGYGWGGYPYGGYGYPPYGYGVPGYVVPQQQNQKEPERIPQ